MGLLSRKGCYTQREEAFFVPLSGPRHRGNSTFPPRLLSQTSLVRLLRVAFRRWHVGHAFRVSKGEIGFGHFEGRNYTALLRHLDARQDVGEEGGVQGGEAGGRRAGDRGAVHRGRPPPSPPGTVRSKPNRPGDVPRAGPLRRVQGPPFFGRGTNRIWESAVLVLE